MKAIKHLTLVVLLFLISSCATNEFDAAKSYRNGLTLKNSKLYIYSFMDLRDGELGKKMLEAMNRQLVDNFKVAGVTATVLNFKDSSVGQYFSLANKNVQVPVRDVIVQNSANEMATGADYRMVIFPSNMRLTGAVKAYDIKWDIFDARSGRIVWSTTSHGKHSTVWKTDEDPDERAQIIIESFLNEMRANKLI